MAVRTAVPATTAHHNVVLASATRGDPLRAPLPATAVTHLPPATAANRGRFLEYATTCGEVTSGRSSGAVTARLRVPCRADGGRGNAHTAAVTGKCYARRVRLIRSVISGGHHMTTPGCGHPVSSLMRTTGQHRLCTSQFCFTTMCGERRETCQPAWRLTSLVACLARSIHFLRLPLTDAPSFAGATPSVLW